jgi:hypothetical protein
MCNSSTGNTIPQKVPAVSRFCGRNIYSLAEIHGHLTDVYDDGVQWLCSVCKCCWELENCRTDIRDDDHTGRLTSGTAMNRARVEGTDLEKPTAHNSRFVLRIAVAHRNCTHWPWCPTATTTKILTLYKGGTTASMCPGIFFMARQPLVGQGVLIIKASRSHPRHTTLGRAPLDEWSDRRRGLYLHNKHPYHQRDSNPQS